MNNEAETAVIQSPRFSFRLSEFEFAQLKSRARQASLTLSELVRDSLYDTGALDLIERAKGQPGQPVGRHCTPVASSGSKTHPRRSMSARSVST
jgi:hypothetical protein